MVDIGDWSKAEQDRLLAWVLVDPPWWYRPAMWLLLTTRRHRSADRLFRWWTRRAVAGLPDALRKRGAKP